MGGSYGGNFNNYEHQNFHGGQNRGRGGFRGGHSSQDRHRGEPEDRPKHRYGIPGCKPWVLVKTKMGRRFVYNTETNESFWKFPADVMKGVVEFDRIEREKKERRERGEPSEDEDQNIVEPDEEASAEADTRSHTKHTRDEGEEDSSEYEEVEVTDDEGDEGSAPKRQRTEEPGNDQPIEFNENDIAYQLAAMGQDYGLDPSEYGNAEDEEWEEGAEGLPLTEEDSKALFRDLLDDCHINPYSTWEKIIEDGHIIQDDRYTVLPNMKSRKECWGEWARDKIQALKEQREKQEKKDPKIPYLAFLQKHATPKLYWPEFRRKYKKEPEMKDMKLSDKEREKCYREHINRLKLSQSTLKSDLSTLLKSLPLSVLNRSTSLAALPPALLTDIRFISLPTSTRDPLVETYVSTLPLAPDGSSTSTEGEAELAKKRAERARREKALAEREKRVQEEKRRQQRDLEFGKGRLRQEEIELQQAMKVGKEGLRAQLGYLADGNSEKGDKGEKVGVEEGKGP